MEVIEVLSRAGIVLPSPEKPVGLYVPTIIHDNRILVSGMCAKKDGRHIVGVVGESMTMEEAQAAARHAGLGVLSAVQAAIGLHRVRQVLRLVAHVRCGAAFTEPHLVANGASGVIAEAFEALGCRANGIGTRAALGHNMLPFGTVFELEAEMAIVF